MNDEAKDLQVRFFEELKKCTADGQQKRSNAGKPPWYIDPAHEAAIYSHLSKWKKGELVDPDSGAHPLVHLAWRALAIACQETGNVPEAAWAEYNKGIDGMRGLGEAVRILRGDA